MDEHEWKDECSEVARDGRHTINKFKTALPVGITIENKKGSNSETRFKTKTVWEMRKVD